MGSIRPNREDLPGYLAPPVLVLGLGNVLLHDEGIGVRVAERLIHEFLLPEEVEVIDGGTTGMGLLDAIAGREHLIVIDAVKTGQPAGTVVNLGDDEISRLFHRHISPHQLALADILAILTYSGERPASVTVIGVEPDDLSTGIGLSPTLAPCVDTLLSMTLQELQNLGMPASPIMFDGQPMDYKHFYIH